jgi:extradiol dioxygenase family protein
MPLRPFHLAIPVDDLAAARAFYGGVLGCPEGRSAATWIDFNLMGHQLVVHHVARRAEADAGSNPVDGDAVPVPHFGVVLSLTDWESLAERVCTAGVRFGIEPHVRFKGEPGEQATMFFRDPAGNALEFKAFRDLGQSFATSGGAG